MANIKQAKDITIIKIIIPRQILSDCSKLVLFGENRISELEAKDPIVSNALSSSKVS